MKKANLLIAVFFALGFAACNKAADTASAISLTPSTASAA
jgi:hypothetical protein